MPLVPSPGYAFLKWTGLALTAGSLTVLPVAVWVSEAWGLIAATAGTVGLCILVFALVRQKAERDASDVP